ncbi:unnamed protein product [Adineta ricciae]|uniref:ATP-dependent RNA helicase SUV3 DEXQ-box helicase domain-containing protein n=1 Tax=Adineta ricciae TaxID=249248 RepID=A0A816C594_ADIRI|nr:unnamed protein product [Adineta ricciae]CAF1620208.1 unnamed protein product [Adineta ricciae]
MHNTIIRTDDFTQTSRLTDEIVVIDETRMIRDPQRGWTSTHTVFGLGANLCGQASKEKVAEELMTMTEDDFEI